MDTDVPDIPDLDTGVGIGLLDLLETFGGAQFGRGAHADVFGTQLLEVQQLLRRRRGRRLDAELDARLFGMDDGQGRSGGGESAKGEAGKLSTIQEAIPRGDYITKGLEVATMHSASFIDALCIS